MTVAPRTPGPAYANLHISGSPSPVRVSAGCRSARAGGDRTGGGVINPEHGVEANGVRLARRPSRSFAIGRLSKRREMSRY